MLSVRPRVSEKPVLHAVDTAKGIAILFVVFGHAWRGSYDAGLIADAALFELIDRLVYAWHIPVFFFLSGLHFLDVVTRSTTKSFLESRVLRLLWPMVLWTWIFFLVKLLAGGSANSPVSMADFPVVPLPPYEHLWFLWALFLVQVVCFGLAMIGLKLLKPKGIQIFFGVVAVSAAVLVPLVSVPSQLFGAAVGHLTYFAAGIAIGHLAYMRPPRWLVAAAGVTAVLLLVGIGQRWPDAFQSLDLVLAICVLISAIDPGKDKPVLLLSVLRYLGQASMAIYVAHTIFSAAFRILLVSFGITSLPLYLVVAVLVGTVGPLLMLWGAQRLRVAKAVGL